VAQEGFRRGASSSPLSLSLPLFAAKSHRRCEINRAPYLNQMTERFRRLKACNGRNVLIAINGGERVTACGSMWETRALLKRQDEASLTAASEIITTIARSALCSRSLRSRNIRNGYFAIMAEGFPSLGERNSSVSHRSHFRRRNARDPTSTTC